MRQMTVNEFRSHLKISVDRAVEGHEPLRVTRRAGADFVVIGASDWEREQETLYVLQNESLMRQISASLETHREGRGRTLSPSELDTLDRV